jgi:sulfur carrier protein ThiS
MSESYIVIPPDSTGKKVRTLARTVGGQEVHERAIVVVDPSTGNVMKVASEDTLSKVLAAIEPQSPVYAVAVNASAVAASKHHLSIWNDSSSYIKIRKVIVSMHETAAVSGYIMQYIMQRASAVSGGTALTIVKLDNRDPDLPSGISAATGATVTLKEAPLAIFALNPEETGAFAQIQFEPPKPIVVAPSEGITIQQYATAGVGLFNAVIFFTVEAS